MTPKPILHGLMFVLITKESLDPTPVFETV